MTGLRNGEVAVLEVWPEERILLVRMRRGRSLVQHRLRGGGHDVFLPASAGPAADPTPLPLIVSCAGTGWLAVTTGLRGRLVSDVGMLRLGPLDGAGDRAGRQTSWLPLDRVRSGSLWCRGWHIELEWLRLSPARLDPRLFRPFQAGTFDLLFPLIVLLSTILHGLAIGAFGTRELSPAQALVDLDHQGPLPALHLRPPARPRRAAEDRVGGDWLAQQARGREPGAWRRGADRNSSDLIDVSEDPLPYWLQPIESPDRSSLAELLSYERSAEDARLASLDDARERLDRGLAAKPFVGDRSTSLVRRVSLPLRSPSRSPGAGAGPAPEASRSVRRPTHASSIRGLAPLLARQARLLRSCYEQALASDESLAGTIELRVIFDASGQVTGLAIQRDELGSSEVTGCVQRRVKRWWRLPLGEAMEVVVPLHFHP